jgi:hypothetical protein
VRLQFTEGRVLEPAVTLTDVKKIPYCEVRDSRYMFKKAISFPSSLSSD